MRLRVRAVDAIVDAIMSAMVSNAKGLHELPRECVTLLTVTSDRHRRHDSNLRRLPQIDIGE
jgi:hypothetical protein